MLGRDHQCAQCGEVESGGDPEFYWRGAGRPLNATQGKARLLGTTGPLLEPGQVMLVPVRIEAPPGLWWPGIGTRWANCSPTTS